MAMTRKTDKPEGRPGDQQRSSRLNQDAPASRPDDEVPAQRRKNPSRDGQHDEHEHPDRRGS
jgi:hypothetical protein